LCSLPDLKTWRDIAIIALIVYVMSGDRESFLRAGMDECLPKPVGIADLLNVIAKLRRASTAENG
jgi:CheY-like chemotaxis protein